MDNLNRDKVSRESKGSTESGSVDRSSSEQRGKLNSDSSASFGQGIGRSEDLNEPSGRTSKSQDSGWQSSSGRNSGVSGSSPSGSSSIGRGSSSMGESDIESDELDRGSKKRGSGGMSGSSENGSSSRH